MPMNFEDFNLHWTSGFHYDMPLKRDAFGPLSDGLAKPWINILTGIRRTGKTTLMKQLIDSLVSSGVDPYDILYFSFDEESTDVRSVMQDFEHKIGKRFALTDRRYYIFLDEVQKVKDWSEQVKIYYDMHKNLKFVVSGSASLLIRKGSRESLAGRTMDIVLPPLGFREYLRFKGLEPMADAQSMHESDLGREFEAYLYRQFIELVNEDLSVVKNYSRSIIEKSIYVDLPKMYPLSDPEGLMSIVKLVSSTPGMLLDYTTVGSHIGKNRNTVSDYVRYLTESYLLKLGYNYSKSMAKTEKKLRRAYLATPTFADMYRPDSVTPISRLVEWSFFMSPDVSYFWRTPQKDEVDLVVTGPYLDQPPLPVEVKYVEDVTSSDLKGLRKFMRSFGVKDGVLITKHTEGTLAVDEGKIRQIPAWKAALDPGLLHREKDH